MSSDNSLKNILDAVYKMALAKRNANKKRPARKKYAELVRVRLGTQVIVSRLGVLQKTRGPGF